MVIVFFSIIVMGACCEPLLHTLQIRMGVNNEEYMREWRNRRKLDGRFHRFEKEFIYDVVVRSSTTNTTDNEAPLIGTKDSFQLGDVEGDWIRWSNSTERATTHMSIGRTLTGSSQFLQSP